MKKILLGIVILSVVFTLNNVVQASTIPPRQTASTVSQKFPHWKKTPINVYIPQNEFGSVAMLHAFQRWQNVTSGKANFKFVDKEDQADIKVLFTDKVDGSESPIGNYNVTIKGLEIQKAEIQIATKNPNIKKYSKDYIFTTMLHEVGHVLGLSENLRKPASIMYMPINEKQDILKTDIRKLYNINEWSWSDRRFND